MAEKGKDSRQNHISSFRTSKDAGNSSTNTSNIKINPKSLLVCHSPPSVTPERHTLRLQKHVLSVHLLPGPLNVL